MVRRSNDRVEGKRNLPNSVANHRSLTQGANPNFCRSVLRKGARNPAVEVDAKSVIAVGEFSGQLIAPKSFIALNRA